MLLSPNIGYFLSNISGIMKCWAVVIKMNRLWSDCLIKKVNKKVEKQMWTGPWRAPLLINFKNIWWTTMTLLLNDQKGDYRERWKNFNGGKLKIQSFVHGSIDRRFSIFLLPLHKTTEIKSQKKMMEDRISVFLEQLNCLSKTG